MKTETRNLLILLILSLLLFFPWLGKAPLWIVDEVRNAECAREMYERGDWIVPTFNGELRTQKPPIHYYFMFGGFRLFGITEWGARFFSACMGLFTILVTYFFIRRFSTARHAFISALVLLCSAHFLFEFRMSVPDPYLIFFNTVALFTAFAYFKETRFYWLLVSAVSLGLGTLAKGPVGFALPAMALCIWLIWEKRWKEMFTWKILVAGLLFLVLTLPWYWLVDRETDGAWTRGFFGYHNLSRFTSALEGHGGLFILVPIFVVAGMLPSGVLIGESLKKFRTRSGDPLWKLSFCVMIAFIGFYCISRTKLPNYPMPCYPFVALLLGHYLLDAWDRPESMKRYPFVILILIYTALPFIGYWALKNEPNTAGLEKLAFLIFILSVGSLLAGWFAFRGKVRKAILTVAVIFIPFQTVVFGILYPRVYEETPLSKTIETVKQYELVAGFRYFHPSFTYYLPHRVPVFGDADSLKSFLGNRRAVVISRESFAEELDSIGLKEKTAVHDIFEGNTTVIYVTGE